MKAIFEGLDLSQIAIPVIESNQITQKDEPTVTVVRTDTFDLIREKRFVKSDGLAFQLTSQSAGRVSVIGSRAEEVGRDFPVPVRPFNDVADALAVAFGGSYRIGEQLGTKSA